MIEPDPLGRLGALADDADAGARPRKRVAEEQEEAEAAERGEDAAVRAPADRESGQRHDHGADGGGHEVGERSADQHGGPPHRQRAEAVDDAGVEVGAEPDRGSHRRRRQVEREQAGDGEVGVAAAAGERDAGAEHVHEQHGEQHRLDGDVGELQRLAGDVHEVSAGEHDRSRIRPASSAPRERAPARPGWVAVMLMRRLPPGRDRGFEVGRLGGVAGEREEHVVERWLVDVDAVGADAGRVEARARRWWRGPSRRSRARAGGVRRG